jgi:hypothetical protein
VVEVPIDKLPVKTIVVGDEHRAVAHIGLEPLLETRHHIRRFIEPK